MASFVYICRASILMPLMYAFSIKSIFLSRAFVRSLKSVKDLISLWCSCVKYWLIWVDFLFMKLRASSIAKVLAFFIWVSWICFKLCSWLLSKFAMYYFNLSGSGLISSSIELSIRLTNLDEPSCKTLFELYFYLMLLTWPIICILFLPVAPGLPMLELLIEFPLFKLMEVTFYWILTFFKLKAVSRFDDARESF